VDVEAVELPETLEEPPKVGRRDHHQVVVLWQFETLGLQTSIGGDVTRPVWELLLLGNQHDDVENSGQRRSKLDQQLRNVFAAQPLPGHHDNASVLFNAERREPPTPNLRTGLAPGSQAGRPRRH
jgi:hypothetical protein